MFIPHYVSCVICHMSQVSCQLSPITCHPSPVTCNIKNNFSLIFSMKKNADFFFIFKKIGHSGGAGRWRVCYQQGLPRPVIIQSIEQQPIICINSGFDVECQDLRSSKHKLISILFIMWPLAINGIKMTITTHTFAVSFQSLTVQNQGHSIHEQR